MKRLLLNILSKMIILLAPGAQLFYPYRIVYIFKKKFLFPLYAAALKPHFKYVGINFYIEPAAEILGFKYISIGDNFTAFKRLRLEAYDFHNGQTFRPQLIIKANVSINYDCHIGCINRIEIGNNVLIGSKVFITDHSHGDITKNALDLPPAKRDLISKGPIIIGNNVWIGENVSILPNVTLGDGCIVGANSVVTKDFPKNSVLAGVPAKCIKSLNVED